MEQPIPAEYPDLVTLAVARAKEGDTDALHFLYVRFADDVCGHLDGIVRNLDESRDITPNVFEQLTTTIQTYEPREVPFAVWILRRSRNAALAHLGVSRNRHGHPPAGVRARVTSVGALSIGGASSRGCPSYQLA
jgi:DNA-directed RNA polymerase specialized sigma24 family protein